MSRFHPTFQEPEIQIEEAILDLWKLDKLASAEAFLTAAIPASQNSTHHLLASRALVRARLGQWDTAINDAKEVFAALFSHTLTLTLIYTKSIKVQSSVIGYIAKSIALVGKGKKHPAYRTCDIAFEHFHSTHVSFLLLVKVCIPRIVPFSCSVCLGYHRVSGRRVRRCDIPHRRPHC